MSTWMTFTITVAKNLLKLSKTRTATSVADYGSIIIILAKKEVFSPKPTILCMECHTG